MLICKACTYSCLWEALALSCCLFPDLHRWGLGFALMGYVSVSVAQTLLKHDNHSWKGDV